MEETTVIIQTNWAQVITLLSGIISVLGGGLLILYRKIVKRQIFMECWLSGIEYVYATKEGNGTAGEIRQHRDRKLKEYNQKHLVKE